MKAKSLTASLLLGVTLANPLLGAGAVTKAEDSIDQVDTHIERTLDKLPEIKDDSRDIKLQETQEDIITQSRDLEIKIPKDSDDPIVLKSKGNKPEISINLPETRDTEKAEQISGNMVAYESEDTFSNIVQPTEDGVRFMTIIQDSSAPKEYKYDVSVEGDYRLEIDTEGVVLVLDKNEEIISAIVKPWAKDAHGKDIPTWFSIRDNELIQHVEHRISDIVYPVTADPWLCGEFIARVSDLWRDGILSVSVLPTNCGRYIARYALRSSFYEVMADSGRWFYDNQYWSMYYQYGCHAIHFPIKNHWNLEPHRPNVGYWSTVLAGCNPN